MHIMDQKIEKCGDGKSVLLSTKKNMDKKLEDELSQWMIEDFFTPYQAS